MKRLATVIIKKLPGPTRNNIVNRRSLKPDRKFRVRTGKRLPNYTCLHAHYALSISRETDREREREREREIRDSSGCRMPRLPCKRREREREKQQPRANLFLRANSPFVFGKKFRVIACTNSSKGLLTLGNFSIKREITRNTGVTSCIIGRTRVNVPSRTRTRTREFFNSWRTCPSKNRRGLSAVELIRLGRFTNFK